MDCLSLISLFTGAGGLDLGLERAGFQPVVCVDKNEECAQTVKHNRDWKFLQSDIHDLETQKILSEAGLNTGDIDLLAGGPPCQPFSKAGYWAEGDVERLDDPRATTLDAYLRVLEHTRPKSFLLESVAGIAYDRKSEGVKLLQDTIQEINNKHGTDYTIQFRQLNTADYGVPQERKRVFFIGFRDGTRFSFPPPTHRRLDRGNAHENSSGQTIQELNLGDLERPMTVWDAIGDLQEPLSEEDLEITSKWGDLLPSIPEGCNYQFHTPRGDGRSLFGWRRRYWNFLLKLAKRFPSWTIPANPGAATGPFHWENRKLSTREMCRLQTFPDEYEVVGDRRSAQRQVGNAVPCAIAELLGKKIHSKLDEEFEYRPELDLLPEKAESIPKPEEPEPIPDRYKGQIDDHEPHPGEGLGPGSQ